MLYLNNRSGSMLYMCYSQLTQWGIVSDAFRRAAARLGSRCPIRYDSIAARRCDELSMTKPRGCTARILFATAASLCQSANRRAIDHCRRTPIYTTTSSLCSSLSVYTHSVD